MSDDNLRRSKKEDQNKEIHMSPSCSSFEVLDPHDPVISRLATQLFKCTNEYLQGEMAAGQDHYTLLEEINRLTITKYADLNNLAVNLGRTLNEYKDMYNNHIKPLLQQIDSIDSQVSQFEACAFRLDSYTKQLSARFKELDEKEHRVGAEWAILRCSPIRIGTGGVVCGPRRSSRRSRRHPSGRHLGPVSQARWAALAGHLERSARAGIYFPLQWSGVPRGGARPRMCSGSSEKFKFLKLKMRKLQFYS